MRSAILIVAMATLLASCSGGPPSPVPTAGVTSSASMTPRLTSASPPAPSTTSPSLPTAVTPICATTASSPAPARSSHPGDGVPDPAGRIVFGRLIREDRVKGQIVSLHAIDADGTDMTQLLACETARPRFSPDGSRLAFGIVMSDQSFQVATMKVDGSDLRVLTSTPGYAETPDWSPDGSWLIYSFAPRACLDFDLCVLEDKNLWNLWRMNADGSDQRLVGNPDTFDWEPRLSPDGSEAVVQRLDPADDLESMTLVVIDLASGKERRVRPDDDRLLEHPDWSPDGRWIIYNPTGCGLCEQIEQVPADDLGAQPQVLYPGGADHWGFKPVYAPDGSGVAFGCFAGLCRMDADGSSVVVVAESVDGAEVNHFDWGIHPSPAP